ncbi:hypothetical protein EVA_19983 [gut metagenome]|uniref:Uncharacterized protein n=1 Tax=gut metagenome TaxID=749906 RepID=J9BWG2_9ZZZZ
MTANRYREEDTNGQLRIPRSHQGRLRQGHRARGRSPRQGVRRHQGPDPLGWRLRPRHRPARPRRGGSRGTGRRLRRARRRRAQPPPLPR